MNAQKPSKKGLYSAALGSAVVALCCFTPALVIAIAAIGLGAFTPYLDYILFPALAIMLVVLFLAYRAYKNECAHCVGTNSKNEIHEHL